MSNALDYSVTNTVQHGFLTRDFTSEVLLLSCFILAINSQLNHWVYILAGIRSLEMGHHQLFQGVAQFLENQ